MSKTAIKLISVVTIILSIMMAFSTVSFADGEEPVAPKTQTEIINTLGKDAEGVNSEALVTFGQKIATVIRAVGIILTVVILMILGIKYMTGSAEEKADYKKSMIPYIVGVVVLFGASMIASAIIGLVG